MNGDRNCPMRLVWDPVLRILHWWMAATLGLQFITGTALMLLDGVLPEASMENLDLLHYAGGGLFAAGLAGRLLWLFIGPVEAGWRDFLPLTARQRSEWLATTRHYLSGLRVKLPRSRAHNPFAATAYLGFFVLGTAQVTLGTILATMEDEARMHSPLLEWHSAGFYLLLLFVAVHLTTVVLREVVGREGIVSAIIHGRKPDCHGYDPDRISSDPNYTQRT